MSVETIKIEVAQRILNLEDEKILIKIQALLNSEKDWYGDLTDDDKASLQKGIDQAERGELISNEDFKKKHFRWH
jgi:hypothetical protein